MRTKLLKWSSFGPHFTQKSSVCPFFVITCWWWTGTNSQSSTSRALTWIQCKLGKQYLLKKFTLPWESNPGPTPNRGDLATLVASVGLKKLRVAIRHYIQVR